jgi:hypothetical protein
MVTETVLAYTAGLFDGEGSVVIDVTRSAIGSPCHSLRITITSTSRMLIDWLLETYEGSASNDTRSSVARGRRPCWAWRLSADHARAFLQDIYPHLVEKRRQASLAIEFQKQKKGSRTSKPLTYQVIAEREWFRQEISRLNLNGKAHRKPAILDTVPGAPEGAEPRPKKTKVRVVRGQNR